VFSKKKKCVDVRGVLEEEARKGFYIGSCDIIRNGVGK
jgi:hypothetical protein